MSRKMIDCRDQPNAEKCTLAISGEENEVLKAAAEHVVSVHGGVDTPELHQQLRKALKDEAEVGYQAPSPGLRSSGADRKAGSEMDQDSSFTG